MITWEKVRSTLQEIIDRKDGTKPLEDEAIVGEMKKAGINVARRTVFRLREQMNIPSSRGRRDWTTGEK
jgi:RNA polymerase sigma-54 factor